MEMEIEEQGSSAKIALKGHLDTLTSKKIEEDLLACGEKYDELVLDVSDVNYISSAGIRVLRNLCRSMYAREGSVKLENLSENVYSVLEMTGLLEIVDR